MECKLISHLPWLQRLQSCTAVPTERPSPWLTLQHVIKGIGQSIHSLVHIVLRPEVRKIQKLSLHPFHIFLSSAECSPIFYPINWIKFTLKCRFPKLPNLKYSVL